MTDLITTERLKLREITAADAPFLNALLNSPGFLKYIGDRGVRSDSEAVAFIDEKYRPSYTQNGFGLWLVQKISREAIGICGFVKRDYLDVPDIGFAFLPEHGGQGYGIESAAAVMNYGQNKLGLERVLAITTQGNLASIRLLGKLGFIDEGLTETPTGETVRLFSFSYD